MRHGCKQHRPILVRPAFGARDLVFAGIQRVPEGFCQWDEDHIAVRPFTCYLHVRTTRAVANGLHAQATQHGMPPPQTLEHVTRQGTHTRVRAQLD